MTKRAAIFGGLPLLVGESDRHVEGFSQLVQENAEQYSEMCHTIASSCNLSTVPKA